MFAKTIFALCLGLFTTGLSYSVLQAGVGSTPATGIYTAAQAQRGKTAYAAKCASCHGEDLDGMGPVPPLDSDEFFGKYDNQPVTVFFEKIQKTMPATAPGTMSAAETADVIAYILSANKYPAGDTELPSDPAGLKKLQLPKPPTP